MQAAYEKDPKGRVDYQAHSQSYRAQLGTLTQVNTLTGKERCIRRLQIAQSLWQWEGDRGWNNFDTGLRQTLERSYLSNGTNRAHSYSTHGHAYEANFVTMKQKKVSTGYVRCIRYSCIVAKLLCTIREPSPGCPNKQQHPNNR